jgi:hypothetical protein
MPQNFMINSTYEFIEICKSTVNPQYLASLDVESLFTNVPVKDTIEIILKHVYNHNTIPAPSIPKAIMEKLLLICTTKSAFRNVNGQLYIQKDGVSMGSPLGPTIASYYMCELENNALSTLRCKPIIYCRYVDDCFLVINNIKELLSLKNFFEVNSVLKFTYETEIKKRLPFLDVLITRSPDSLKTTVFNKKTNTNECINFKSICPLKYKTAVIKTFLHRAHHVCSDWESFHIEMVRIKQVLINNGFPITLVDANIKLFLNNAYNRPENTSSELPPIVLYYRNQFTSSAKTDEGNLRKLLLKHVHPSAKYQDLHLRIFYKNKKLKSLFISNKIYNSNAKSHVVYQFSCPRDGCNSSKYIGYTTCSLAKRFYTHVQTGAIRDHNRVVHSTKPLTQLLLASTTVLYQGTNKNDLTIAESLLIQQHRPELNQQDEGMKRVLKIF